MGETRYQHGDWSGAETDHESSLVDNTEVMLCACVDEVKTCFHILNLIKGLRVLILGVVPCKDLPEEALAACKALTSQLHYCATVLEEWCGCCSVRHSRGGNILSSIVDLF